MAIQVADDKLVRGSEILELYEDAGWTLMGSREAPAVEESVRQTDIYLVARDGARLVGLLSALTDRAYYAHVTEFLVRRSHQRRGIGTALFQRLLEEIKQERVISIFAEPDAEPFYRRFGFATTAGGMLLRRS